MFVIDFKDNTRKHEETDVSKTYKALNRLKKIKLCRSQHLLTKQ